MQTFLPYKSFRKSARCLDNKRLGKQRVEAMQILNILLGENQKAGWSNHPAVLQWAGFERALFDYLLSVCAEWKRRGYKNSKLDAYIEAQLSKQRMLRVVTYPNWLGKQKFHDSHKSRLLQKDPNWYGQFGWNVARDLDYAWPVRKESVAIRSAAKAASRPRR